MKLTLIGLLLAAAGALQGCATTGAAGAGTDSERPQALTGQGPTAGDSEVRRDGPPGLGGKSYHQFSGR